MSFPTNANATNNFGVAALIVDPTAGRGTHTTIANALTSAVSGQTIFIRPGTYTENLTLQAGVNLTAFPGDDQTPNVTIVGNITCTGAGTRTISGIRLQTNSAPFLTVSANAAIVVYVKNCYLNCTNNTGISYSSANTGANLFFINCRGNIGATGIALYSGSGAGGIDFEYCEIENSGASTTASNNSSSAVSLTYCTVLCTFSTSSTGTINVRNTTIDTSAINRTCVTTSGTGAATMVANSTLSSGTASALSIGSGTTCRASTSIIDCTNTNAITGAGILKYSGLSFFNTSSLVNTTTQIPNIQTNDGIKITSPGAYPYTTVPQDGVILVDTSSARTINPLSGPTTGQMHIIKDNVGSAASNNITITPFGNNIDGAASKTINTAYGSVTIVYNGTEWSII